MTPVTVIAAALLLTLAAAALPARMVRLAGGLALAALLAGFGAIIVAAGA